MTTLDHGVAAVEARLAFLDQLPDELLRLVFAIRVGSLRERVDGVAGWRTALLAGELPPAAPTPWPGYLTGGWLRNALEQLDIARFCAGRPDLVDAILAGVLRDLIFATAETTKLVEQQKRALLREQNDPRRRLTKKDLECALAGIEKEAEQDLAAIVSGNVGDAWRERVAAWSQLAEVFGDLGDLLGVGYDLTLGVLRHHGWKDMVGLSKLLEAEPRLRDLVAQLGRDARAEAGAEETVIERIAASFSRVGEVVRDVPMPGIPPDVRGVTRSDDLARLLPSETMLLRHPLARRLFLARFAEKGLATYQVEGVEPQRVLAEIDEVGEVEQETRRRVDGAGPILLCIDTSGSMAGAPETVAKAIALEAMRVAHKEGRRCLVWSFSGPGQTRDHELKLTADGIAELFGFLLTSFHGGTDVGAPLTAACAKLEDGNWHRADLAIITDGAFEPSREVRARIDRARRERGLRVRGVLVGRSDPGGLREVADVIEHVTDWVSLSTRDR
jgi:uncharacterized protein with von Willebrand factor type A (vWA) domain